MQKIRMSENWRFAQRIVDMMDEVDEMDIGKAWAAFRFSQLDLHLTLLSTHPSALSTILLPQPYRLINLIHPAVAPHVLREKVELFFTPLVVVEIFGNGHMAFASSAGDVFQE